MKKVTIRQCTHRDIDGIFQLENAWEEEGISHVFNPVSREDFMTEFERFTKYYFVAESEGWIVGYINGSVQVNDKVDVLPKGVTYLDVENLMCCLNFETGRWVRLADRRLRLPRRSWDRKRFIVGSVTKDMDRSKCPISATDLNHECAILSNRNRGTRQPHLAPSTIFSQLSFHSLFRLPFLSSRGKRCT
jgi:hypothetical protein